ncbi:lipid A biosynthesis lauroyl acyltransferase [Nitratifractor sp.]
MNDRPRTPLPLGFRLLQGILRAIPYRVHLRMIGLLARAAVRIDRRHTHVARVNLDLAFGDTLDESEKARIVRRSYENLMVVALDTILNQGASKEQILSKVRFENEAILEEAIQSGRPIIFVTAHYGNWELGTLAIAAKFHLPLSVVGRPLDWDWANRILTATREQFGVRMIPKRKAMKPMIEVMRRRETLGLVVDQNTSEKQGELIGFFGHPARHTPAAAILARKFDAVVIPVYSHTTDYRRWTVTFHEPLPMPRSDDPEADILEHVRLQAAVTERVIRQKPDEWLWLHRRWKNQYEELYKRDKR